MFCGPNELDDLSARLIADLLEADGYEVTYGGGNIADDDIMAEVHERREDLAPGYARKRAYTRITQTIVVQPECSQVLREGAGAPNKPAEPAAAATEQNDSANTDADAASPGKRGRAEPGDSSQAAKRQRVADARKAAQGAGAADGASFKL